jgi:hypothetical protein
LHRQQLQPQVRGADGEFLSPIASSTSNSSVGGGNNFINRHRFHQPVTFCSPNFPGPIGSGSSSATTTNVGDSMVGK